jgi:hypothetical protein
MNKKSKEREKDLNEQKQNFNYFYDDLEKTYLLSI